MRHMTILQVIGARERDLGGFVVRRVLPFEGRQMVGPFIFFDHLGPTQFPPGHEAYGLTSPVATLWPTLYVDARLQRGARLPVPESTERAVYVAQGEVMIEGTRLREGQLGLIAPDSPTVVEAIANSRVMLLGGERFTSPRYLWWNFVASSRERIEAAKTRWANREFDAVPGETEFIPLPRP
jgi:redox-sensitive bicupin YhaK (pirin superfamily)